MTRITENSIESLAVEMLVKLGYEYIYAPRIAPDSTTPERASFNQVLLLERLELAVKKINHFLPFLLLFH